LKKFVQQKNLEKKILKENYFDRKNEVIFFDMLSKSIFKLFEKKVKKMSHGKNFIVQTLIHNILSRIILATEKSCAEKI